MSSTSLAVMSSSPSSPSICSPLERSSSTSSRRSARRRTVTSRSLRRATRRTQRLAAILGRHLARIRRGRVIHPPAIEPQHDAVVPDLNNAIQVAGDMEQVQPFAPVAPPPVLNFPNPIGGFAVLAVVPPPPENPFAPVPPFPMEEPNLNLVPQVNGLPMFVVTVKSSSDVDLGVVYYIRGDETFERVYFDYATRVDRAVDEILIYNRHGSYIDKYDTPVGVGVANFDALFVLGQNPEHNMNTRVKHFYVRDHRTHPLKVKVTGDLVAPLSGLYELFGQVAGFDLDHLMISHENGLLTRIHNVRDAGIKNDQELFALPNV